MAVAATVTAGKIFQDGESVTVSELNKLGTPTVDISGAVGTLSLTDGSVTNAKVASAAGIQLDKLQSGSSAQVVVANSSGVPTYVALSGDATISDAGALTLVADSVETAQITDANVTTAKIADDAVTADKLANTAVTAGSYEKADITVDAQGRVTAAVSGTDTYSVTVISAAGSSTWSRPAGATLIRVTAVGGGGGGASGGGSGGDGGLGGTVSDWIDVTSVSSVAVVVGTGGAGAPYSTNNGDTGTATTFGSYLTANGGGGGEGTGGTGSTGTVDASQVSAQVSGALASGDYGKGGNGVTTGAGGDGDGGAVIVQVIR